MFKVRHRPSGEETIEPPLSLNAGIHLSTARFFSNRRKYDVEDSPSSTHLMRDRTWAPLAASRSRDARDSSAERYGPTQDTEPASTLVFKCATKSASRDLLRAPPADLLLQYLMVSPLRRLFPASHHLARVEKLSTEPCQACQKSEIRRTYSASFKTAVLSFHRPGPEGMESGTETETCTPQ